MESPLPTQKRSRRRWYPRFRLRTFLLIATVLASLLTWVIHRSERQRLAIEAIEEHGGWVAYRHQVEGFEVDYRKTAWVPQWCLDRMGPDLFYSVTYVSFVYSNPVGSGRTDNRNLAPAPLHVLRDLPWLEELYLKEGQATDDNLSHVADLGRLRRFYIWDADQVTDKGISYLAGMKNLESVHLSGSQATDRLLEILGTMPRLERLSLQDNHFSDEGLLHLKNLDRLETLWVCGDRDRRNEITVVGLEPVLKLPNLNTLAVQHTRIRQKHAVQIQADHPGLRLVYTKR